MFATKPSHIRIIVIAVACIIGAGLGIWARPWLNAKIEITPDNSNAWILGVHITLAMVSMIAIAIMGYWITKIIDRNGML